jgi:hypothetical protein
MFKKIGLGTMGLAAALALAAPNKARAEVRFGVTIGGPVYAAPVAPYAYGYANPYYYGNPTYGGYYGYAAPYREDRRDGDRHEWNERDRHDQREHRDRGGWDYQDRGGRR